MAPIGKGRNGKGTKRKNSSQTAGNNTNKNIRRSQSVDDQMDQSQLTQLTQQSSYQSQSNDSSDWEDQDQDDHKTCSLCSGSLNTRAVDDDDPSEQLFCDYCGVGSHLKCLKVESAIDGPFKDLISLIGWICIKCKESLKHRIQKLENTCTSLKSEITKLKTSNGSLLKELTVLKSSLHPPPVNNNPSAQTKPVSIPVATDTRAIRTGSVQSYASVASAVSKSPENLSIENIIKAIHLDTMSKDRKRTNIVVSGLKPMKNKDTKEQVSEFLHQYWNIPMTTTITCRRLGSVKLDKIQPLLISLPDASIASEIIREARILRHSTDPYVKANVYVNPDRTKAEGLAAFELREQRRKAKGESSTNASNGNLNPKAPSFSPDASLLPVTVQPAQSATTSVAPAPTASTSSSSAGIVIDGFDISSFRQIGMILIEREQSISAVLFI